MNAEICPIHPRSASEVTLDVWGNPLLTIQEKERLAQYIKAFLAKPQHAPYFDQNPDELLESLVDPNRLSIALMPCDKHISRSGNHRAVNAWYYKYVKRYSRSHRQFLNRMEPALKTKLFTSKLLRHPREKHIRDFLGELAGTGELSAVGRRFVRGLDPRRDLLKQGVRVLDCQDFSSGRGYDEGAIVNRIVLSRNNGRVALFLKGLGNVRKMKVEAYGIAKFENFEVTALKAARIVGLNSIRCKKYDDRADPAMVGYTLFQEVAGINTNHLFRRSPDYRFEIQPAYAPFRDRLIREFARVAAFSDLLRKGDRKIVQPIHPEYDANCLVNLELLQRHSRRPAIWVIDFNHLFQPDNRGVLQDITLGQCAEIGILSAFPQFHSGPTARSRLFARYEKSYLAQWARIQRKWQDLEGLISELHGRRSAEYNIFRESLVADPRLEFQTQKAALLRAAAKHARESKPATSYS
jgi:hypothetical protein